MKKITPFFKGMTKEHITQVFHSGHEALDVAGNKTNFGYGTPLCAPEECEVLGTTKEELSHDNKSLEYGYGIRLKGLETGLRYLLWHTLPIFPVREGDKVERAQIVAYMGNAGNVYQGGAYVPVEKRTTVPFKGTHLHIQAENSKGKKVDLLPLIDFTRQPAYTKAEAVSATLKVLAKMSKVIN